MKLHVNAVIKKKGLATYLKSVIVSMQPIEETTRQFNEFIRNYNFLNDKESFKLLSRIVFDNINTINKKHSYNNFNYDLFHNQTISNKFKIKYFLKLLKTTKKYPDSYGNGVLKFSLWQEAKLQKKYKMDLDAAISRNRYNQDIVVTMASLKNTIHYQDFPLLLAKYIEVNKLPLNVEENINDDVLQEISYYFIAHCDSYYSNLKLEDVFRVFINYPSILINSIIKQCNNETSNIIDISKLFEYFLKFLHNNKKELFLQLLKTINDTNLNEAGLYFKQQMLK